MYILLAPEKIISSTTIEDWKELAHLDLVLFTSNNIEYRNFLRDFHGAIFSQIEYFDNYATNDTLELKILEYAKHHTIKNIIPMTEADVLRTSIIKDLLKMDGIKLDQAMVFRDKIIMKEIAKKHQINIPRFKRIKNSIDLYEFINEVGYPIIIKPILGRGSLNTLLIKDPVELHKFLNDGLISNTSRYPDLLAEEFLDVEIYHIDGLQLNNEIYVISASKYVNNCLSFVNGNFLGSYTLEMQNPLRSKLLSFSQNLLNNVYHLPKNSLFHIEVFVDKNDTISLCEIACRIGGNGINDEVKFQQGVDIKMAFIKAECGMRQSAKNIQSIFPVVGRLLIPPKEAKLLSIPEVCEISDVIRYQSRGKIGKNFNKMMMSNDEIASFLIKSSSEASICEKITQIADWFNENTTWGIY